MTNWLHRRRVEGGRIEYKAWWNPDYGSPSFHLYSRKAMVNWTKVCSLIEQVLVDLNTEVIVCQPYNLQIKRARIAVKANFKSTFRHYLPKTQIKVDFVSPEC